MALPSSSEAHTFFEAIARRYDRVYAPSAAETRAHMARILARLPTAARVLDLGVGTGRELPFLLDAGHAPTGVDSSEAMLALCGKRARPVPLVRCDFWEGLPFARGSFDAVIALHGTLSHPPSEAHARGLVRAIASVLRRGGTFVAELPSAGWLEALGAGWVSPDGDRSIAREPSGECQTHSVSVHVRHTDHTTGASVVASIDDEATWRARFEPSMWNDVSFTPIDRTEMLLVACAEDSGRLPSR